MPKVQKQHQPSIDCADAVLHDANVKHPRDINAPAIAARHGARIVYGALSTSRANIVRAGRRAIITIDETAEGTARARSTIGHELGHHKMHEADHFEQCDPEERRSGTAWR